MSRLLAPVSFGLLAVFLILTSVRSYGDTTTLWVSASIVTFAICWSSATHLLGVRAASTFILIALAFGWFAEQMGASRGWFFGEYDYTDVLGPTLGEVPIVVPLMWFSLTYMGYVIANLIVWHSPVDRSVHLGERLIVSVLAALIVTAYDLGMDPYMVFVLKAWIMVKTDGAWFTETVQGFVGWAIVSFVIVMAFRFIEGRMEARPAAPFGRLHALVPLVIYSAMMIGQVFTGHPVETRTIAVFAMGIPAICALAGWRYWQTIDPDLPAQEATRVR